MRKGLAIVLGLVILLSAACSSTTPTTPLPTPTPLPRQTSVNPRGAPTSALSGTSAPAASAPNSASPTTVPTTPIPTSTSAPPTPVIPDGLYVTSLDIVPDPPVRGLELLFYATFANTTNATQNFRWLVYLYRSDNPVTSFGQTTVTSSSESLGAHTEKSLGFWKLPLGGPCENFVARVELMDQNNQTTPFRKPDGQVFERAFSVCAPNDLPSPTPAAPSQPTPVPTPPPGLFVTDLRTDPNPPARGADLIFYPTFSNTTSITQNYRWIVYIFNPDDPFRRIGETTATQTGFPAGVSEQKSLGSWKLSLGGPCQEIVARMNWLDQNNKANQFTQPDGLPFEKDLTVCPP